MRWVLLIVFAARKIRFTEEACKVTRWPVRKERNKVREEVRREGKEDLAGQCLVIFPF